MQAHLALQLADAEAGRLLLDDQRADATWASVGIGARHHRVDIGLARARHPELRAIEDVVIAITPRQAADAGDIGTRVRLTERKRAERLTRRHAGQPALALLIVAEFGDQPAHHIVDGEPDGGGHIGLGDLLIDDGAGQPRELRAAILLRDECARQPQLAQRRKEFTREVAFLVPLFGVRRDLLLREFAHQVAYLLLLVIET